MKKLFGLSFQYTSLMLFTLSSHAILWIFLPHNAVVAATVGNPVNRCIVALLHHRYQHEL